MFQPLSPCPHRAQIDHGQQLLNGFPPPTRTDNHFIVDPAKWDFYAMDAYRLVGDDEPATRHALEVLHSGVSPEGIELSPMRVSEARLTLGVAAARSGDLEQATDLGIAALSGPRRSLPSLLMVAGELDGELNRRYPDEPLTADFRERLRALHRQPA